MKPILIASLASALVAGFVGAATAVVLTSRDQAPAAQRDTAAPHADAAATAHNKDAATTAAAAETQALRDRVSALSSDLDSLHQQFDALRDGLARQAAPSAEVAATAPVGVDQLASVQRDAVVQIMNEERDKEQAKRDEERKQREQQQIADRASRMAKDLGLGAADERKLTDFMTVASAKRDEMFKGTRDGNFDRDAMRKSFDDYRAWTETELNSTFGANLGAQILKAYRDQRGDWGGGGGGPPWQGGGQGGQTQGGNTGGGQQRQGRG